MIAIAELARTESSGGSKTVEVVADTVQGALAALSEPLRDGDELTILLAIVEASTEVCDRLRSRIAIALGLDWHGQWSRDVRFFEARVLRVDVHARSTLPDGKETSMAGPHTTIYLRNTFRLKRKDWTNPEDRVKEYGQMLIKGKEAFVQYTYQQQGWKLVAAFGEYPLLRDGVVLEPDGELVQIWQLPTWDSLYNTMSDVSEAEWYRKLGEALACEDHELLINAGVLDPTSRLHWQSDDEPGYVYFYEIVRPRGHCHHAYLRDVYWLNARMSSKSGWELVWWGSQITGQPAELAVLWRVPHRRDVPANSIPQELLAIAYEEGARYDHMAGILQTSERRIYYPIYTERLAELLPSKTIPARGTP